MAFPSSLLASYYTESGGYAAYATLSGLPTLCGGGSDRRVQYPCMSYAKDGEWAEMGRLQEAKQRMGFIQLAEDQMLMTGDSRQPR